MKKDNLPICDTNISIKDIIHTITKGKCGLAIVMTNSTIEGIITYGDIRRAMEENEDKFFTLKAQDLMSKMPKLIDENKKLVEANEVMSTNKINSLLVINSDKNLCGIVQLYDL
jgi:arabinose-5-phosphate isomerase